MQLLGSQLMGMGTSQDAIHCVIPHYNNIHGKSVLHVNNVYLQVVQGLASHVAGCTPPETGSACSGTSASHHPVLPGYVSS